MGNETLSSDYPQSVPRRSREFYARLGIADSSYPQIIADVIAHANAPRAWLGAQPPWQAIGPRNLGGRILCVAQSPVNPLELYAGSAHGGLWRTRDRGDTWEHLDDPAHNARVFNVPVCAIALHRDAPDVLYVGTGSPYNTDPSGTGLWQITLGTPVRFRNLAPAPGGHTPPAELSATSGSAQRYPRIRVDLDDPRRFWAASQTGLWRCEMHSGNPVFTRDFPGPVASGGAAPTPESEIRPDPHAAWDPYVTDVLVARDPRSDDKHGGVPRHLILHVAVSGRMIRQGGAWTHSPGGVFRGRFDRSDRTIRWEKRLDVPHVDINATAGRRRRFRRVQLAQCERRPTHVFAVFSNDPGSGNNEHAHASHVFRSTDNGESWTRRGRIPRAFLYTGASTDGQADFDLVLEVNPDNPDILICGEIDLCRSTDGGLNWTPIMQWERHDNGARGEHGDQHCAHFDHFDRRILWSGHDGGLSQARDVGATPGAPDFWRPRSHGIAASQFQHLAISTGHNFVCGGGLQDNGMWLSFGGPTWYHIGGGDGGGLRIDPGNPRRVFGTSQNFHVIYTIIASTANPNYTSPVVHDLPASVAPRNSIGVRDTNVTGVPRLGDGATPFVPVVAQHPTQAGRLIYCWTELTGPTSRIAYSTINGGAASTPLLNNTGGTLVVGAGITASAARFAPEFVGGANVDGWLGLTNGRIFVTNNAPAGRWAEATRLPGAPSAGNEGMIVSSIAVHPLDNRMVAVCLAQPRGRVYLTYNRGRTWRDITERRPTRIDVTPAAPNIAQGQHRQMTARATYTGGDVLDVTARAQWQSATAAVARFNAETGREGQIEARSAGTSDVTAALMGVTSGTQRVTVGAAAGAGAALGRTPRGNPDVRGLPPCPMAAVAFALTGANQWALFVGTVGGAYELPGVPFPRSLTVQHAGAAIGAAIGIPAGQTRAFTVQCRFSDGNDHDVTRDVDWSAPAGWLGFGTANTAGHLAVGGGAPAGGNTLVTVRRGAVTATFTVNVAGLNPPAVANAPAGAHPTVNADWRPHRNRLPLTLVNDLAVIPGLGNTSILRAATMGRGMWDCQLTPARPQYRLFIRHTVIEDGRTYPRPAAFAIADDPRLVAGAAALDHTHAFDIRVDSSPFQFFDDRVDGVEMDEDMAVDTLAALRRNAVHVQVHNSGRDTIRRVHVHLYFMLSLDNAAPPNPVNAPAGGAADPVPGGLRPVAEFYRPGNDYDPLPRPAGVAIGQRWQRVAARQEIGPLVPGQPVVARFDWIPPIELAGRPVALLALCSGQNNQDTLPNAPAGGPGVAAFLLAEPRAALRIVPASPAPPSAVYIRDGVSDLGQSGPPGAPGSIIAFPARSPDIIVPHPIPGGDAKTVFRDLLDPRPQDFLQAGQQNAIFVRVHNRGARQVEAEIELWAIAIGPDSAPAVGAAWTQIAANTPGNARRNVAPDDWHWVRFQWQPGDPNPGEGYKAYLLVALVRTTDGQDVLPDRALATTVERLWRFLGRLQGDDNAAARALRVRT